MSMYDIRSNKYEAPTELRFADEDEDNELVATGVRLLQDDGTPIVAITNEDGGAMLYLSEESAAKALIQALNHCIKEGWWEDSEGSE